MENRCREGSLDKNNLPQSLNDNTHTQLCHRAFQALFVCLCICECNRVIISVYVNLHTICATKSANSIYSSIHNVSCYSPFWVTWFTSQTFYSDLLFTWDHLRHCMWTTVLHSLLLAFVSLRIRSDVLGTWRVILKGAVPFRTLYPSFSKETKRFIITVRK